MVSDTANRRGSLKFQLHDWKDPGGKPLFLLGLVLVALSIFAGIATYLILTGLTPITPNHSVVVTVLIINAVLVLGMIEPVHGYLVFVEYEFLLMVVRAVGHALVLAVTTLVYAGFTRFWAKDYPLTQAPKDWKPQTRLLGIERFRLGPLQWWAVSLGPRRRSSEEHWPRHH